MEQYNEIESVSNRNLGRFSRNFTHRDEDYNGRGYIYVKKRFIQNIGLINF